MRDDKRIPIELAQRIQSALGAWPDGSATKFEIRVDGGINVPKLLALCDILGCTPEQLFWNPDLDYSGCYYDGDTPATCIRFEVRK